jgi:hypothetical protein
MERHIDEIARAIIAAYEAWVSPSTPLHLGQYQSLIIPIVDDPMAVAFSWESPGKHRPSR